MKLLKNNRGFTLVELIVVIVILGVLAGVGAPQIFKYVKNSRLAAIKSNCAMVESVVNNIYAEVGNFNSAFNNTAPAYNPATVATDVTAKAVIDKYLQNNKTLASMNLSVKTVTPGTKTIVLSIDSKKAGIDGNELGGTDNPWGNPGVGNDPTYTIVIKDSL